MRIGEKHTKKLLVEGNDDQHVVWALCEQFQIPENFDVIDCDGISNLTKQIPVRFKAPGVDTIGIIMDADEDLSIRWDSLKKVLSQIGFILPDNLSDTGLIVDNGKQKAGVWVMPDNNINGMLEDFVSFLIPDDDKLFPIANGILEHIETEKLNKYKAIHRTKALIHTWLAWQEDPGTPMGLSITKKYLTTDTVLCTKFVDWMKKLFV